MNAQRENRLMVAHLLGIAEEDASTRLAATVAITTDGSSEIAYEFTEIIGRTLTVVTDGRADVEVVFSSESSSRSETRFFVSLDADGLVVSREGPSVIEPCHPLLAAIASCYVAGVVVSAAVGIHMGQPSPFRVDFKKLGISADMLQKRPFLEDAALAGAGAVGNGFLRALRHIDVHGSLAVVDPKKVSDGNTNRCLYFTDESIRNEKAEELSQRAQADFKNLKLMSYVGDFQTMLRVGIRNGCDGSLWELTAVGFVAVFRKSIPLR